MQYFQASPFPIKMRTLLRTRETSLRFLSYIVVGTRNSATYKIAAPLFDEQLEYTKISNADG